MSWSHWLMTEDKFGTAFTPIEIHADDHFDVVVGMCLMTSLESMKNRTEVKKIWRVGDIYNPTLTIPELVYDRSSEYNK